jgi:hypothetical protein
LGEETIIQEYMYAMMIHRREDEVLMYMRRLTPDCWKRLLKIVDKRIREEGLAALREELKRPEVITWSGADWQAPPGQQKVPRGNKNWALTCALGCRQPRMRSYYRRHGTQGQLDAS